MPVHVPVERRGALAAFAPAAALLAALALAAGCGGSTCGTADARAELDRLSASLRSQRSEIRKLIARIDDLERRLGTRGAVARRPAARRTAPRRGRAAAGGESSGPAVSAPPQPATSQPATSRRPAPAASSRAGDAPRRPRSDIDSTLKVQKALKLADCDPGPVNGKMGPITAAALKRFQKKNNLPETGMADPDTWALLQRYQPGGGSSE